MARYGIAPRRLLPLERKHRVANNFTEFVEQALKRLRVNCCHPVDTKRAAMRFLLLVVGAVAMGALSAVGIQTIYPQSAQTFQAMRATIADFKLADLNPVTRAYNDVMQKITSPDFGRSIDLPQGPAFKIAPINPGAWRPQYQIDDRQIQRAVGASINNQIQQSIRQSQDMAAYTRNPMAWHGPPPH
jgi:hypothetical protein